MASRPSYRALSSIWLPGATKRECITVRTWRVYLRTYVRVSGRRIKLYGEDIQNTNPACNIDALVGVLLSRQNDGAASIRLQ